MNMSMKQKFSMYNLKQLLHILQDKIVLQGAENKISLIQTYSKVFHCTYLLHDYPFDTQVCKKN